MELAAAAAKSTSAWDEPGTLGFLVVFGLAVILFFVFRSLTKHLRKINEAARLEAARAEPDEASTDEASTVRASTVQGGPVSSAPGSDGR